MTGRVENLDSRRSFDSQTNVESRRREFQNRSPDHPVIASMPDAALQSQMLAGPADSWPDIARKAVFLIERFARTSEAQDEQLQALIRRALHDVKRANRREKRKP